MLRSVLPRVAGLVLLLAASVSCAPTPRAGSLPPTLTLAERDGFTVAMQNGIPVPTFDRQPRQTLTLDGTWRFEVDDLDSRLSLTDRSAALEPILTEADGRQSSTYNDRDWGTIQVPGSLNDPPDGEETGAWYRRDFRVPARWRGNVATLKMDGVNYLADVWLNGEWLGYHEGGYTPFAFDVSRQLVPGSVNTIAVRVDNPAWGSRNDIVPWGLADWWNYGGITRSVWIEATPPLHVVRADVVPHLDGVDVSAIVRRAETVMGGEPAPIGSPPASPEAREEPELAVRLRVFTAEVRPDNLTDPQARALISPFGRAASTLDLPIDGLSEAGLASVEGSFLLGDADTWSPARPALYVLQASIVADGLEGDAMWTSFGMRHVSVDPDRGRLLLNGEPTMLTGVGLHDEVLEPAATEAEVGGHRVLATEELLAQLDRARSVDAELIRAAHTPAPPMLLTLADRLGFAIWEEIPLYHYTPLTFGIAEKRGIAEQMLREMALRDMNRPSVLFHGLANESTGVDERQRMLQLLHDADRQIDGTRLTGQAAYGFDPDDPTHAPLDVAGFTFYYDVFYGSSAAAGTAAALDTAHTTHPGKPVLALEFGRWSDDNDGLARQRRIFEETFPRFAERSAVRADGFVGGAVWWTLEDYATERPGIGIEHFGLFDATTSPRPAAEAAERAFSGVAGEGADLRFESSVGRAGAVAETEGAPLLLVYLAYAVLVSVGLLGGILFLLLHRGGGRSMPRRRPSA